MLQLFVVGLSRQQHAHDIMRRPHRCMQGLCGEPTTDVASFMAALCSMQASMLAQAITTEVVACTCLCVDVLLLHSAAQD